MASRHASRPTTKKAAKPIVEIIDILGADDEQLLRISRERLLSLNIHEMRKIVAHYRKLERNPTDVELEVLAQTWSEHCKHKVFNGIIDYTENGAQETIDNLFKQTIVQATADIRKKLGKSDWCISVFKDNAGIVKFDEKNHFVFKVETHNHPSALDPYGGANTGIGGVIRDPLGTGLGATPIFNTNVFCFAPPDMPHSEVPKGVLHPKRILKGVVAGVRDYGNRMGIPTINGSLHFDIRYLGNPVVYCGTGGLLPVECTVKKVGKGDLAVAIGGRTGRDGIHGATFSSIELDDNSEVSSSGAVQIGNAIVEKKALDVILQARAEKLYTCITDCGAGGFSSAAGEMGSSVGITVQLDKAPLKYGGLMPWEILLSEAQERMVLSVPPKHLARFMALCAGEDVEATVIGEFDGSRRFIIKFGGETVANLEMSFLHGGVPRYPRKAVWNSPKHKEPNFAPVNNLTPWLVKILASYNVASKEWVVRQYDHEVQGCSAIKPLTGVEDDGPGDAAVITPVYGSFRGIAVSNGISIRYGDIDAYWMAASAIDEAMRNVVAVGGDPEKTAILDNFVWGNPDKPDRLGDLVRASRACYDVAVEYGTPFISGKDSFNNEFAMDNGETIAIPPTLLISATAIVPDVRKCTTMDFKAAGDSIYVIGETFDELGGSQYFQERGCIGNSVPKLNAKKSKKILKAMHKAIKAGLVKACHDISDGGLAVALAESCFAGGLGAQIDASLIPGAENIKRDDNLLFSESNSRFIVEITPEKEAAFKKLFNALPYSKVGAVTKEGTLIIKGRSATPVVKASIKKLKEAWKSSLAL